MSYTPWISSVSSDFLLLTTQVYSQLTSEQIIK